MTPAELVTAIVTERGVHRAPYATSLPTSRASDDDRGVDPGDSSVLERFGFEPALFEALRQRVATGELSPESNVVRGVVEPPSPGDVVRLPAPGDPGYDDAHAAGIDALGKGEVAQVVLAGGMATRFGGIVKAAVPAVDGRSFLEVKLSETHGSSGRWMSTFPSR